MNVQSLIGLTTGQEKPRVALSDNKPSIALKTEDGEAANETTANATTAGEEFDTFLTLLTAQIRNQDPLAPLDSTQFVEQLATFSGLELQASGNAILENIANMLAQNLYATQAQDVETNNDT